MNSERPSPFVALVGAPNCGKTSLFNLLTGSRQKVGNYPGVTVERKEGRIKGAGGGWIRVLDLPGTYSLKASTPDEAVTREVLLEGHLEGTLPALIVAVADATNLERSLSLVLEVQALGIPTLLVLNMMDLAKARGFNLDLEKLSQELGVRVFPVIARKRKSVLALQSAIERYFSDELEIPLSASSLGFSALISSQASPKDQLQARYRRIDEILQKCQGHSVRPPLWTERLDRVLLHPLWGTLLLYLVLALVFQAIFNWAQAPMDWIEAGIGMLGDSLSPHLPEGWVRSLLVDGVLAGVGSVVVFLPQIFLLFLMILLLEDSGYMARAAFLMDRHMRRVGLHGRAFLPLLSSFACAIPGIMATRTIENPKDRLATILIAPLMACSARVPVYTLLISAFIPNRVVWGPLRLQGLVMLGLYLLGAFSAFGVAWIFKKIFFYGKETVFLLELPTYKWPNMRNVILGLWERVRLFLKRAGTVILAASIAVWFLSSYPKAPENLPAGHSSLEYSFAGKLGHGIEPWIRPLGFDWTIGVGLVTGMVAREVIVSTLATLYSLEAQTPGQDKNNSSTMGEGESSLENLVTLLQSRWSTATGLSLLVFFVFAMQCLSTLAVVRRETNSWRWPLWMFTYLTALAYFASWCTYRLALLA